MSKQKVAAAVMNDPVKFAIAAGVLLGVGYFVLRTAVGDAAKVAGGLVSGNNAITKGTPYEGAGVVGTVAGSVDKASGGVLSSIGGWLGGKIYDWTHEEYDPNKGFAQAPQKLSEGAANTDALWGPIGSVKLRAGG